MYAFLSPSQRKAVEAIERGDNVFITGCAGSGKSYLLQYLKSNINDRFLQLTATTGVAAINIGGTTLHSWASLGLEELPVLETAKRIMSARGTTIRKKIQSTDVLAIDEISMLSKETFESVDLLLQIVRGNSEPFGGIQIILFGDFFQLPPVKSQNFCFESESWKNADIKTILLTEVFRQNDARFVELLNNIRYGRIVNEDIQLLKTRYRIKYDGVIKPTILSTHNLSVERINFQYLRDLPTQEHTYEASFSGDKKKIEILKKSCIAKESLTLRVGAQVIMLKNSYAKDGIINGSTGIVIGFSSSSKKYPVVQFENGKEITVKPDTWEMGNFNPETKEFEVDAYMTQIPLNLAWAITIHKSQGMTLDRAECDLAKSFAEGQIYVALSRVKSLDGLFIKSFDVNNIKINRKILDFYNSL